MEFEDVVANQLIGLGYPIFYRNLKVYYHRRNLAEFDIVSDGFIVEVKSGRSHRTRGLNLMRSCNMLPKDYIYYIYCPMLSDEEIACLNTGFATPTMCYINSYSPIIAAHRPQREAVLANESVLANLLNMPWSAITRFTKLYVHPKDYARIWTRVEKFRDRYSYADNMKWSDKLTLLVKQGRMEISSSPPVNVPPMIRTTYPLLSVWLQALAPFSIPRIYYVNLMPKDRSMVDLYYSYEPMQPDAPKP
jgi:hypothetical protein